MTKDATTHDNEARILVVDDEPDLRTLYELTLLREGYQVETAATLSEARDCLKSHRYDLLITDMRLPDGMGLELITELKAQSRTERAIVITAYGSAENAVEALKLGAFDYLTKPVDLKQFRTVVATAAQGRGIGTSQAASRPPAPPPHSAASRTLAGDSPAMTLVRERVTRVAASMAPVMILGESGTGKELVARAIHDASHRAPGPFVAVNCGAIPESLIEAEFFGARKGAYTGATTDREGYFSAARGGTLFLDEIGDLPIAMQAKLLRVIQERKVRPLGGVQEELVDVRVLCATHKNLSAAVDKGHFRQDLFYRLNVIEIRLPALRERREDLPTLVQVLMSRICAESGQFPAELSRDAREWLFQHPFAGNVRELENLLHRALALCNGHSIELMDLQDGQEQAPVPRELPAQPPTTGAPSGGSSVPTGNSPIETAPGLNTSTPLAPPPTAVSDGLPADLQQHLDEQERAILVRALAETRGNRTAAAAKLGLNLRQIRYRISRLNIPMGVPDPQGDLLDNETSEGTPSSTGPAA